MDMRKASRFLVAVIVGAATLSLSLRAAEEDAAAVKDDAAEGLRWLLRVRGIYVSPDESSEITVIGGDANASNDVVPDVSITYFITDNWAVELMAATTCNGVTASGTVLGDVDLGDIWLLPPTLTLQYHLRVAENIRAYAGAGINYTWFYNEELPEGIVTDIDYDNGLGWVLQAGVDYELDERWVLNLDVKKLFLNTDVDLNDGAIEADVDLDPWIVGVGVGYRF